VRVVARSTSSDRIERCATDGVDVANGSLRERLNVEQDVVRHEFFGPVAAGTAQTGADVRASFVECEACEPLMRGSSQGTAVELRDQVGHQILATCQRQDMDDRAIAQLQMSDGLELAQHWFRQALEAVSHDKGQSAVGRLVTEINLENPTQLAGRAIHGSGTDLLNQLPQELLGRFAAGVDP